MEINLFLKDKQSSLRNISQLSSTKKIDQKPIGLRNIGNTCFLNSIIQFLYAVEELRNSLISIYKDQSSMKEAKFPKLLGKLFFYIRQKCEDSTKMDEILRLMVLRLEGVNSRYCKYRQEDALQTLLNVLIEVESKHPDLARIFDVEYQVRCQCAELRIKERVLDYAPNQCVTCRSTLLRTLVSKPKYIIYSNIGDRSKHKASIESIKIEQDQKTTRIKFRLTAQITYFGSGRVGHYVTHRLDDKSWFRLHDSHVYSIQKKYEWQDKLILLYQLQNQQLQTNKIQIKNEQTQKTSSYLQVQISNDVQKTSQSQPENKVIVQNKQKEKIDYTFLSHKIQYNKIYQFKLKINNSQEYSLFITIWAMLPDKYFRIFIKNRQWTFKNKFQDIFDQFYDKSVKCMPNQLQALGKYFQDLIDQCAFQPNKQQIYYLERHKIPKKAQNSADFVYNLQADTIEVKALTPLRQQAKQIPILTGTQL